MLDVTGLVNHRTHTNILRLLLVPSWVIPTCMRPFESLPNSHVKRFLAASSWPPRDVRDSHFATPFLFPFLSIRAGKISLLLMGNRGRGFSSSDFISIVRLHSGITLVFIDF